MILLCAIGCQSGSVDFRIQIESGYRMDSNMNNASKER